MHKASVGGAISSEWRGRDKMVEADAWAVESLAFGFAAAYVLLVGTSYVVLECIGA